MAGPTDGTGLGPEDGHTENGNETALVIVWSWGWKVLLNPVDQAIRQSRLKERVRRRHNSAGAVQRGECSR
jgi:hypothetical protein